MGSSQVAGILFLVRSEILLSLLELVLGNDEGRPRRIDILRLGLPSDIVQVLLGFITPLIDSCNGLQRLSLRQSGFLL